MKKTVLTFIIVVSFFATYSQNIQLHRDFGKDRNYFTTTVEMFKPDNWGNTFFFIDMDYGGDNIDGVRLAYWELARCFKFWEFPISVHTEYNGGFGRWSDGKISGAYPINNSWLGGVDYSWNAEDFSKGFSAKALYKYIEDKHDASFQLTFVWYAHFFDKRVSFTGFMDFWREDNTFDNEKTKYVFISEPQLWYNFTKNFSLGGEVELSYNFAGMEGFNAMPTLGVKWTL